MQRDVIKARWFKIVAVPILALCVTSTATFAASPRQQLNETLRQFEQAQQGYVPGEEAITLRAYRLTAWSETLPSLDSVIANGTPSQQRAARQLKAAVLGTLAQEDIAQAEFEFRRIANEMTGLISRVGMVNHLASVVMLNQSDDQAVQSQLSQAHAKFTSERQVLQQRQQQYTQQRNEHQQNIQTLREEAAQLRERADELTQQAFVETGTTRFDLQDNAAELEAQADAIDIRIDLAQVQVEDLTSKLDVIEMEITLTNDSVSLLDHAQNRVSQRQQSRSQEASKYTQEVQAKATELFAAIDQVVSELDDAVNRPIQNALTQIKSAKELIQAAMQGAPAQAQQTLRQTKLQLLIAELEATAALLRSKGEIGFALQTIQAVASSDTPLSQVLRRPGGQLPQLSSIINPLKEEQQQLLVGFSDGGDSLVNQAIEEAGQLSNEELSREMLQRIEQIRDHVNDMLID